MEEFKTTSFTCVVKPIKFIESLKEYKNEDFIKLFTQDMVIGICIFTKDENIQDEMEKTLEEYISYLCSRRLVHISQDEIYKSIKQIIDYGNNGISMGIESYLRLLFISSCMCKIEKDQECIKISFRSVSQKCQHKVLGNFFKFYYIISTDENLTREPYINDVINIIDKKAYDISHSKKKKAKIRSPITKSIRYEVFKRDNFKCVICGKTNKETSLEIDHIIPVSRGGTDTLNNLQTLCCACNLSKREKILDNHILNQDDTTN